MSHVKQTDKLAREALVAITSHFPYLIFNFHLQLWRAQPFGAPELQKWGLDLAPTQKFHSTLKIQLASQSPSARLVLKSSTRQR